MGIELYKENNFILLKYFSENNLEWLKEKFKKNNTHTLKKIYTFSEKDVYQEIKEDIYITTNDNSLKSGQIPFNEFKGLIKNFPNTYELNLYTNSRISRIIENYFESCSNSKEKYERYINQKEKYKKEQISPKIKQNEKNKYEFIICKWPCCRRI